MVGEFLSAIVSWKTFLLSLLVFGFAPGAVLRLIVLAFRRDDPRRREMIAELYRVPRLERPYWVLQQLEVALSEGVWERIADAATGRIIHRWYLASGVELNRQHPETFEIPDEEAKQAIEPGVLVTLSFDVGDVLGRPMWGERMWVEVVAVKKRHIIGTLRNEPVAIPRLHFGDQVKFKRDHIIDICREASDLSESAAGDTEQERPVTVHRGCHRLHESPAGDGAEPPSPSGPSAA